MKRLLPITLFIIGICGNANAQDSTKLKLLYNWQDSTLPGSFPYNNVYNEVWGLEINGGMYAIIGATDGTHFFDITDKDSIEKVAYVPGEVQGGTIVHRDYHDYQGYLYAVSDEGPSTLQIMDLHFLPDSVPLAYDSDSLFQRSHNIFIDTNNATLYACGVNKSNGATPFSSAMRIFDISTPLNPVYLYDYSDVSYVHDVYVRENIAYSNAGNSGLFVADFTNIPTSHTALGSLTSYSTWKQGYNHSGWLDDGGDNYYFADETWGYPMKACDVTDLSDIQIIDSFSSHINPQSIAHNLIVGGDKLFVSHYHDGLYIYDITDPLHPVEWAKYKTYDSLDHTSYRGAWGVFPFYPKTPIVLVSDMQFGLFVFEMTMPSGLNSPPTQDFDFQIFPNPVVDDLQVQGSNHAPNGDKVWRINDLQGRTMLSGTSSDQLSLNNLDDKLPSGFYIFQLISEGNHYSISFVKQ